MFVPFIMGSDKTTASAGTGQVDYWPIYGSIGNIHNNIRRAHGSGLVLIGFLAIPKSKQIKLCESVQSDNRVQPPRNIASRLTFVGSVDNCFMHRWQRYSIPSNQE
jgi:hypothetical protein